MFAAFILLLVLLGWAAVTVFRKVKRNRRISRRREFVGQLSRKIIDICELATREDRFAFIHRGLPGYTTMFVHPDFQLHLSEHGWLAEAGPQHRRITHALQWWANDMYLMIGLCGDQVSFHAIGKEANDTDARLIPAARSTEEYKLISDLLDAFYSYLKLPASLTEAKNSPAAKPNVAPVVAPVSRAPRQYEIHAADKIRHICDYIDDGDYRTFFEMFDSDAGSDIILWVDHREDDADIPKLCERILRTASLDGCWDADEGLDLIIRYKGTGHRVHYPRGFADRDTTMIELNRIIADEFELRYCTASDGGDTAAFLPLRKEEWRALESRYGDRLKPLFTSVTDGFGKFGGYDD